MICKMLNLNPCHAYGFTQLILTLNKISELNHIKMGNDGKSKKAALTTLISNLETQCAVFFLSLVYHSNKLKVKLKLKSQIT